MSRPVLSNSADGPRVSVNGIDQGPGQIGHTADPMVEALSRRFHAVYQVESRRQAEIGEDEVRHPDDYDALPEHTKEYDRVLARDVLKFLALLEAGLSNQTGFPIQIAQVVRAWAKAPV